MNIFHNWYISYFKVGELTFNCVEQFVMYKKAIMSGNNKAATEILKCKSPSKQHKIGKKIKPDKTWDVDEVTMEGIKAKFLQNDDILYRLLNDHDDLYKIPGGDMLIKLKEELYRTCFSCKFPEKFCKCDDYSSDQSVYTEPIASLKSVNSFKGMS
jgi:hypothetical protein